MLGVEPRPQEPVSCLLSAIVALLNFVFLDNDYDETVVSSVGLPCVPRTGLRYHHRLWVGIRTFRIREVRSE